MNSKIHKVLAVLLLFPLPKLAYANTASGDEAIPALISLAIMYMIILLAILVIGMSARFTNAKKTKIKKAAAEFHN